MLLDFIYKNIFYNNILMYSLDIRMTLVKLYYELKKQNIIGKKRIVLIKQCASSGFHIHSLYNQLKNINIKIHKKYTNFKITNDIENFANKIEKILRRKIL